MKRGLDQMVALIIAVIVASSIFTGLYLLSKLANKKAEEAKEAEIARLTHDADGNEHNDIFNHDGDESTDERHDSQDSEQKEKHEKLSGEPSLGQHSNVRWGYKGLEGPLYWGELDKSFIPCSIGKEQSPVDIVKPERSKDHRSIQFSYHTTGIELINDSHAIKATLKNENNYIEIDGKKYTLFYMYFHAPSEHKVDGIPYDFEIHFMHRNEHDEFVAVALFGEEGKNNSELGKLWKLFPKKNKDPIQVRKFNLARLLPKQKTYYAYEGSLTIPPCTEGIKWFVLEKSIQLSPRQIDDYIRNIKFNARPIQKLNKRDVYRSWK